MMSNWEECDVCNKVIGILQSVQYGDHHFGRPFISAYQLAIALNEKEPAIKQQLGLEIGGMETGSHVSFSQYLARELSQRIKSQKITNIEGAFLGNLHLKDISFNVPNEPKAIHSSLTDSGWPLSMFRFIDEK